MKRIIWTTLVAFVLVLTSCAPATATPIPPLVLDIADSPATNSVSASAVVVPTQESRLSFVISGMVQEVTVEEGDHVQAGQELATLDTTELGYTIVAAEAALVSAEINAKLQRYRDRKIDFNTGKIVYRSGPREKILVADAKVEQMQAALEVAKASLAQGTLVAPFDGTVVGVNVSAGEYVQASQRVVFIADLGHLQIETTDLSELNVAAIKIGQPATVFVEALNEEFPGKVTSISPISDTIGGDVVFIVTINLDEQSQALLWGMSADVVINIE